MQEALISGLEQGELMVKDSQDASRFIIRNMDVVESPEELYLVLKELGEKWSALKSVYITFKQKETLSLDEKKLAELQAKIKQLSQMQ